VFTSAPTSTINAKHLLSTCGLFLPRKKRLFTSDDPELIFYDCYALKRKKVTFSSFTG
jgi:hypothetical protein